MSNNAMNDAPRIHIEASLLESLVQICGGGLYLEENEGEDSTIHHDDKEWKLHLEKVAKTSISFPNKRQSPQDGKPHDVEIRCALGLFHKCAGQKRKRSEAPPIVTAISNLGLKRSISTPLQLASLLCVVLEESLRKENLSHDVRPNASGIICLVTLQRAQALRQAGRLPCPQCTKWCKGEKGLWWHQQMEHGMEHSTAAAVAASEQETLAIVPYCDRESFLVQTSSIMPPTTSSSCVSNESSDENVFDLVREGKLEAIKGAMKNGFDPKETLDRNGASLLHWAAGCGHSEICRYLIETCDCSPNVGQKGKRSFSGRTPLLWAARNGHLAVVQYLVNECRVDIDATTLDGTSAFCWASWQAHLPIMRFLYENGADVEKTNSFGCNAVLWCAQGEGTVETMQWLQSIGLNLYTTNSNGHGALHKAAQRKRKDLCEWLCIIFARPDCRETEKCSPFGLIGPDSEGFCPSDLAGAAGDDELAAFIAKQEIMLACLWVTNVREVAGHFRDNLPAWLCREDYFTTLIVDDNKLNVWEPQGGVRRIRLGLKNNGERLE